MRGERWGVGSCRKTVFSFPFVRVESDRVTSTARVVAVATVAATMAAAVAARLVEWFWGALSL